MEPRGSVGPPKAALLDVVGDASCQWRDVEVDLRQCGRVNLRQCGGSVAQCEGGFVILVQFYSSSIS